jgi:autotransporter-associated beta strand protein
MAMRKSSILVVAAVMLGWSGDYAAADTWLPNGNGSWADETNWDTSVVPDSVGETVDFNAVSGPNRTVTVDSGAPGFTVGTINYNSGASPTAQTTSITQGDDGDSHLIIDNGDSDAVITTGGTGLGNFTISAPFTLNSNVVATVNQTSQTSQSGSLNLTATIDGDGGFTKNGIGMMTFGTNDKLYNGPTVLNNGWLRMSYSGRTQNTSSFTINDNALLELINPQPMTTVGNYTLGPGSLTLNGDGFAPAGTPQGVIRPQRTNVVGGRQNIINNPVTLQSDSLVHVQSFSFTGSNSGVDDLSHSLTFTGVISGGGALYQTALDSNQELGRVILSGANTYSGGTFVRGGRMEVSGSSATFGTGDITVYNPATVLTNIAGINGAIARLVIPTGVTNAISDTATVFLGGSSRGVASLASGVIETVGAINFNGTLVTTPGEYSDVTHPDFFEGTGVFRIGLLGDHNGDGTVDAADYVGWRKIPSMFGDDDGYDDWRENFAEGDGGGGGSAGVPEPAAVVLVGLALPLTLAGRRRRAW